MSTKKLELQVGYGGETLEIEKWRGGTNIWLPEGFEVVVGTVKVDNWAKGKIWNAVCSGEIDHFFYKLYIRKHAIGIVYNPAKVVLTNPPLQAKPPNIEATAQ